MQSVIVLLLLSIGMGFSCLTDPLDRVYHDTTLEADLRAILAHDTPDSSAYKQINQYLLVSAFNPEQLTGKTYREILELYALWEARQRLRETEAQAEAERSDREQELLSKSLKKVVEVTLDTLDVQYGDTTKTVTYLITFRNKSKRAIRAVEGSLEANYGLSGYFLSIDQTFTKPLAAHSSHQEKNTVIFYKKAHEAEDRSIGKVNWIWHPQSVRYVQNR